MVVWNSMLLKIIIMPLGVVKQHVRFIFTFWRSLYKYWSNHLVISSSRLIRFSGLPERESS
jgi:hypothetical protein